MPLGRCYSGTSKLDPVNKAPSNTRDLGSGHTSANLPHNPLVSAPPDGEDSCRLLRAAVNELGAQYEEEGHQLKDAINVALEKTHRLRKKYKRPDHSSDRLYGSGVIHPPDDESSCAAICGDDPSNLILDSRVREPRGSRKRGLICNTTLEAYIRTN
ncbi:hypothetical protein B0J13DRAFT_534095 [Dactylonectria estremocensis]|uniref:Uncharacterized protein n=1 Tax=Dactylonectria estremocensis TaxID=1079267 RepID=A0A9P9D412_9HYPO|nr:hypothetical protein B0J13DRAFT_534095 [Dactylonectria estremocensis]